MTALPVEFYPLIATFLTIFLLCTINLFNQSTMQNKKIWREFYTQAAALYKMAPWTFMQETEIFAIKTTRTGTRYFISIMGSAGEYPAMAAYEVAECFEQTMRETPVDFVVLNFANPDMVGHTGVLPAAIKAVETIDRCLDRITEKVLALGGQALVTADHGNCEQMIDPATGGPHTAHTTNPVPIYWITRDAAGRRLRNGGLADLAPTVLGLLELPVPPEMTGRNLIVPA